MFREFTAVLALAAAATAFMLGCGYQAPLDSKAGQPTTSTNGLEVSIVPRKPVHAGGESLAFVVTVRNVSEKPLRLKEIGNVARNTLSRQGTDYKAGVHIRGEFQENIGLFLRLSSARGHGAPPPGEDVPSVELYPQKSTTFDLDFPPGTEYALAKTEPLQTVKDLPPGPYQAVFAFRFAPPYTFKDGKFVNLPDPSFWVGEVTTPSVEFEIAPQKQETR